MDATIHTEIKWWDDFLQGSVTAYEAIVRHFYQSLYNYGRQFTVDKELIKDTIQELFLHLWKNRLTLNATPSVKFYLLKAFRRKLLRRLSNEMKIAGRTLDISEFEASEKFNPVFEPISFIENDIISTEKTLELAVYLRDIIARLPKRQQEIIYLKFFCEAEVREIAEIMRITRQSVYNLLHEALKNLKIFSSARSGLEAALTFCFFC